MRTFPVDDDVVALVWEQAKPAPFEQLSFSDALRRVLMGKKAEVDAPVGPMPKAQPSKTPETLPELDAVPSSRSESRARAPKADLRELVRLGILKEGQELIFMDYKGHPQPGHKATVAGADLVYKGMRCSMSALSSLLLKQEGYIAESVRGPEHWATADGKRIREHWEGVLRQRVEN